MNRFLLVLLINLSIYNISICDDLVLKDVVSKVVENKVNKKNIVANDKEVEKDKDKGKIENREGKKDVKKFKNNSKKVELYKCLASVNDNYITIYQVKKYQEMMELLFNINIKDKEALEGLIDQYILLENTVKKGMGVNKMQLNQAIDMMIQNLNQDKNVFLNTLQSRDLYINFENYIKCKLLLDSYVAQFANISEQDKILFGVKEESGLDKSSALYTIKNVDIKELYYDDFLELIKQSKVANVLDNVKIYWRDNTSIFYY